LQHETRSEPSPAPRNYGNYFRRPAGGYVAALAPVVENVTGAGGKPIEQCRLDL
jgi:hypothetical protein